MVPAGLSSTKKFPTEPIREKMEFVDQLLQKYTLNPCSFQQRFNTRGEKHKLQSEKKMKGNV